MDKRGAGSRGMYKFNESAPAATENQGQARPQAAPQYQQYQQGPQAQPKQPGRKAERFNETKDAMVSGTRYRQISGGFFPLAQEIVVEKNPGYVKLSIVKAGISGIGQKELLPAAE